MVKIYAPKKRLQKIKNKKVLIHQELLKYEITLINDYGQMINTLVEYKNLNTKNLHEIYKTVKSEYISTQYSIWILEKLLRFLLNKLLELKSFENNIKVTDVDKVALKPLLNHVNILIQITRGEIQYKNKLTKKYKENLFLIHNKVIQMRDNIKKDGQKFIDLVVEQLETTKSLKDAAQECLQQKDYNAMCNVYQNFQILKKLNF